MGLRIRFSSTVTAAPNPVPTLTAISPLQAAVGSSGFTLEATGTGFIQGVTELRWNGQVERNHSHRVGLNSVQRYSQPILLLLDDSSNDIQSRTIRGNERSADIYDYESGTR